MIYKTLFLILLPIFSIAQEEFNKDSVTIYFGQILNEYRYINNLQPLSIEYRLKNFTESHAKHMSEIGKVTHGNGSDTFYLRMRRYLNDVKIGGENCTEIIIPKKGSLPKLIHQIDELNPLIANGLLNGFSNYDVAKYAFIQWKHSKSHNEFLLNSDVNKYFLSYSNNNRRFYFEYVAIKY